MGMETPMTQQCFVAIAAGLLAVGLPAAPSAADPPDGAKHVENMAGCFSVLYRFVEDGIHDALSPDYGLDEPIIEWIELQRGAGSELTLVHYSITDDGRAVPHFHEVWISRRDGTAWTQQVWSHLPDDPARELRYSCTAPWQKNLWQCHAGEAAKPFRDSGAPFGFDRADYDVLDRDNSVLVTQAGWVHSQHNRKLTEAGELLSYELGWITYRRIDADPCAVAAANEG